MERNSNTTNRTNLKPSSPKTRGYDAAFKPNTPPGLHIDLTGSSDSKESNHASRKQSVASKKRKTSVSSHQLMHSVKFTKDNFVDLT